MVNNNAIINIINKITVKNTAPCKKTLQKIVFLIQAKGVDLGCDYGIHFFGPYSADLDYAVREMNDEGILNIEYTSMEHRISVSKENEIQEYHNTIVDTIINEFAGETPSELELLATALYAYLNSKDVSRIKHTVIKIKGSKYSDARIDSAIERLKKLDYIVA